MLELHRDSSGPRQYSSNRLPFDTVLLDQLRADVAMSRDLLLCPISTINVIPDRFFRIKERPLSASTRFAAIEDVRLGLKEMVRTSGDLAFEPALRILGEDPPRLSTADGMSIYAMLERAAATLSNPDQQNRFFNAIDAFVPLLHEEHWQEDLLLIHDNENILHRRHIPQEVLSQLTDVPLSPSAWHSDVISEQCLVLVKVQGAVFHGSV